MGKSRGPSSGKRGRAMSEALRTQIAGNGNSDQAGEQFRPVKMKKPENQEVGDVYFSEQRD